MNGEGVGNERGGEARVDMGELDGADREVLCGVGDDDDHAGGVFKVRGAGACQQWVASLRVGEDGLRAPDKDKMVVSHEGEEAGAFLDLRGKLEKLGVESVQPFTDLVEGGQSGVETQSEARFHGDQIMRRAPVMQPSRSQR